MVEMTENITRYRVKGLHCASCVRRLEDALKAVPGVQDAKVNLADASATIIAQDAALDLSIRAAKDTGYPIEQALDGDDTPDEISPLKRDALIAAILVLPVFLAEMGSHLFPPLHHFIGRITRHIRKIR